MDKTEAKAEKFRKDLSPTVLKAKRIMLDILTQRNLNGKDLGKDIIQRLNLTYDKDDFPIHKTKPVHLLSYILAYKQLEKEKKIVIKRPATVPFPMTDDTISGRKQLLREIRKRGL